MAGTAIRIAVLANASQAKKELNSTATTAEKIGGSMSKLRVPAALAIGAVGLLAKSSIKAASDAQQSLGGTQAVFGKYADTVIKRSNQASDAYGLSANSYRESANVIGSLLKNQGVQQDQLAGKTDRMVKLGSDLAATYGGTTKDAVEALASAYKGEFDPLERYGVSLKQSAVNAEALKQANVKTTAAYNKLTPAQQKAAQGAAIQALLMKQAAPAQGQFAKQTGTLAEKQQIAAAKFENAKAALGAGLLPIMSQAADVAAKLAGAMEKHGTATKVAIGAIVGLSAVVLAAGAAQKIYNAGLLIYNGIQKTIWAATVVWRNAQLALNLAMIANPVGLIVAAIVALIAIIVLVVAKNDWLRAKFVAVWNAIKAVIFGAVSAVINFVKSHWPLILALIAGPIGLVVLAVVRNWDKIKAATKAAWNAVKAAVSAVVRAVVTVIRAQFTLAKTVVTAAWNAVKAATVRIWNGIKAVVRAQVGLLMAIIRGIKGKITGIFAGAAGWLLNAGKRIIGGLISGIDSMIGKVKDKLHSLTSLIPLHKGPPRKDARLLKPAGQAIIEGLIDGFDSRRAAVRKTLETLSKDISTFSASPTASVKLDAAGAYASRTGQPIEVAASVRLSAQQLSQVQRGREIHADLKAYTEKTSK